MSSKHDLLLAWQKRRYIAFSVLAMCCTVTASNILVQYPVYWFGLNELLTYGAFTYPFAFLVNDLTNRFYGPTAARRVVYAGFFAGIFVSWILATPRLAIASSLAFLFGQLLDIVVFAPLRRKTWWKAPLAAALVGSALDTVLFFSLAFSSFFAFFDHITHYPNSSLIGNTVLGAIEIPVWLSLAFGDFSVKIVMSLFMLIPYGTILSILKLPLYQNFSKDKASLASHHK
ncbi:VUT family protein [Bartonella raoultii]|uniref:Probable queuosine precursor transporter n=1 Tax=Bartonella raoultii TaxID=1457020 RepID=A0ABS7I687_9HYPH|nr:VUT family protein [Bartonella raoultii]MBX4335935.1 VUT family protein [Bartonella raoultii]